MPQTLENREKAVSYLLGELPRAESDLLEERLFLDEDYSLFISDVENDLIDEYVRGELSAGEKLKFENAYLTSETRRERVRAAQVMETKLFAETQEKAITAIEPQVSFGESLHAFFRLPNFALAGGLAVILLVLLGAVWFLTIGDIDQGIVKVEDNTNVSFPAPPKTPGDFPENNQPNTENSLANNSQVNKTPVDANKPKIEPEKPETDKTPELQKEVPPAPQRIYAFTLLPPTRSGDRPVLKIPESAKQIRLRILNNIEEKYIKYTAEITDENGETVLKKDFASAGKKAKKTIVLNLPGEALKSGAYEITLLGTSAEGDVEEINFYNFTVNKQ